MVKSLRTLLKLAKRDLDALRRALAAELAREADCIERMRGHEQTIVSEQQLAQRDYESARAYGGYAVAALAIRRALGAEHELTTLERGEDLLARLEAGQRFDALLSDLHMPGLSGPALYQRVRALDPALAERTIFMSGGAVTPEVKEFIEANQERLIPKPLDMPKLKAALASLAQRTEAPRA